MIPFAPCRPPYGISNSPYRISIKAADRPYRVSYNCPSRVRVRACARETPSC